jgi:hypothetical protein
MLSSTPHASNATAVEGRPSQLVVLVCPRCSRIDHISAEAYAMWTSGIRCGLCGPPYVTMEARLAPVPHH